MRPTRLFRSEVPGQLARLSVQVDADDLELLFRELFLQVLHDLHVLLARLTPSRPVVNKHDVASKLSDVEHLAVNRSAFQRKRLSDAL